MKSYLFLFRLSSFMGRAVVFFFISSFAILFFYLIGNYQGFLDSTQLFLLAVLNVSLILHIIVAAYSLAFLIMRIAEKKRFSILRFLLLLVSMILSSGLLVFMRFLQSWLRA
jgi:hypothetical protein